MLLQNIANNVLLQTIFRYRLWRPCSQRGSGDVSKPSPLEAARGPQEIPDSMARDETAVSLYVLNAAGLTKPHDIEHLAADLSSYATHVATITETHFRTNRKLWRGSQISNLGHVTLTTPTLGANLSCIG